MDPSLFDVTILTLAPGDVLVAQVCGLATTEFLLALRGRLELAFPGHPVFVLDTETQVRVQVVRP